MANQGALALLLVLLQFRSLRVFASEKGVLPDKGVIISQVVNMQEELNNYLENNVGYAKLSQDYSRSLLDPGATLDFKKVDGMALSRDMARRLGYVLGNKTEALKRAVEFAEEASKNFTWSRSSQVDYIAAKSINDSSPEYEYSPLFKQKVNRNSSSIHIPVEIYDGNIDILNDLRWSSAMDEIWKKNRERDPDILWQYFGSQKGVMRSFPASKWKTTGPVDLYDVRRRPWYTQGASSPKDMLILVDVSGSTHGQALQLMKVSISSLLDTLGENDFVNIVAFAETATPVGCFGTFVQANYRNKKILNHYVDQLKAKGMARYKVGLRYAFEQFRKFRRDAKDGQGANCNGVIMFLTDGGTEMPEDVFEEYNWPNKTIRIFTYAVGPTANPLAAVRWIACANRGYYAKIPAMGAIRSTVQMHAAIVARPLPLLDVRLYQWSNVYSDALSNYYEALGNTMSFSLHRDHAWSRGYLDFWGLGLMTTVTLPVYNKSEAGSSNQTILGVMGVDITVQDMQKLTPYRKLGPNGYAFAINNNGYIVFHPHLKAQNGYLKDPPNVDFLEVEHESPDKTQLRKMMILNEEGMRKIRTHVIVPDELHTDISSRRYHYTGIPGSNFSMAIVLPGYTNAYVDIKGLSKKTGVEHLSTDKTAVLVAPWEYCPNITQLHNESTPAMDLSDRIDEAYSSCDRKILQHLFWDLNVTRAMEDFWRAKMSIENVRDGLDAMFVSTNGGLTRVYPPSAHERLAGVTDTWEAVYYKRAFDNTNWMFSVPYTSEPNADGMAPSVMATKAINISVAVGGEGVIYKPAVVGALMKQDYLRFFMTYHVKDCNRNDTFICYLLDDGGFLVTTNQQDLMDKVGMFIGSIDAGLMKHLFNKTSPPVYKRKIELDYQAACPDVVSYVSAAGPKSVYIPAFYEMLTLQWWTTKFAWVYLNFNIYNWLFGSHTNYAYGNDYQEYGPNVQNKSCIKERAQYFFGEESKKSVEGRIPSLNCTREFKSVKLEATNLLLVMLLNDCPNYDNDDTILKHKPSVVHDPESNPEGICTEEKRFRARAEPCYDYSSAEDDLDCGGSTHVAPSILLLFIALQVTWLHIKLGFTGS